ncbi:hypothetical protein NX722_13120 [Endozoicomonas gorgoniicola]|uniref:Uncharacterized protein n=1 Tax=Endozoicomonas gorgoniicola TaxID=1234144 RepID=A0ABT3MVZ9_9GAMM|nr:hypothetical protein [Endozoicomonas gorgoniicola]MCW7553549.1 hypothetical protein [Endozoicomonas gorgoniicola]
MLDEERIFAGSNLLRLHNPAKFQNTMNVEGASYLCGSWCRNLDNDAVLVKASPSYFSGYVYRTQYGIPGEILESGFHLTASRCEREELFKRLCGLHGGNTFNSGILTSICASFSSNSLMSKVPATLVYGHDRNLTVHTYLIDATEFKGFAIPCTCPQDPIVTQFPYLREICEVNFPNIIPGFKIVGIVFPAKIGHSHNTHWPPRPSRLLLAVNPHYSANFAYGNKEKKGIRAARVVAERFNKKG